VIGEAINFFDYRPDNLSIQNGKLMGELAPYEVAIYKMETITNIHNNGEQIKVTAFPNPASDMVNIESPIKITAIRVLNITGQVVMDIEVNATNHQLDVSDLRRGMYVFKIKSEEGSIVKKVMLE